MTLSIIDRPSPNHGPRVLGVPLDMLVIHYTGMQSAQDALARLCDPDSRVSAHWVIDEDGTVHRLVSEDRRAWHAGSARWRNTSDINSRSIGIELVNPGHEWGYRRFTEPQMAALEELARGIVGRHGIAPGNVVGHSDIAPERKLDPGELFDWRRLARAGVGVWPRPASEDGGPWTDEAVAELLDRIGYGLEPGLTTVIAAFQRHYRPAAITGSADAETVAQLRALMRAIGG